MLERMLNPLPGGERFIVPPTERYELPVPMPQPNTAVVVRYVVEAVPAGMAPQSSAVAVDYVQFVARPAPAMGIIVLQDFQGSSAQVPVRVQIRCESGIREEVIHTSEFGIFEIEGIELGLYGFSLKASYWLRRTLPAVQVPEDLPVFLDVALKNGDIDDEVTLFDFGTLVAAFGSTPGDPSWNPNTDLNGGEEVTLLDFGILVQNFGATGDEWCPIGWRRALRLHPSDVIRARTISHSYAVLTSYTSAVK